MWAFQYKHGDRPLEGYTIQRAAGRGGFGEVYYAVSDSGREVALKVVQGYEQIELRGISQCMNLKSPHLVSIFDVKHNHEGKPFVIMEFVSGPNLRQLLDESPAGLGTQKAAFFLREIAKGLSFLHECGIVHRDLKPANIFYENGYVKIGDYGLSKAITTSQYSGQTVTVGTVHYMAPEIGAGKYDRSIDIYAMGAVLYEMLTGMPPYVGSSASEVLMKHLSAEPDVRNIPQPFARVIQKAMAKDPNQRYKTVQEMVEDVFGAEHVRQSVSVFAPEDLSVIAERAVKKTPVAVGAGIGGGGGAGGSSAPGPNEADQWARLGTMMDQFGGRVKQMWNDPAPAAPASGGPTLDFSAPPVAVNDPLPPRHRWQIAILVSVVAPVAAGLVTRRGFDSPFLSMMFVFLTVWGGAMGQLFAYRAVVPRTGTPPGWMQRLVVGQMVALGAILFSLPVWLSDADERTVATFVAILVPYFLFDSKKEIAHDRAERVEFGHVFGGAVAAFVLSLIFQGHTMLAIASAAGIALIVQVLAPWDPSAAALARQRRAADKDEDPSFTLEVTAGVGEAPPPPLPTTEPPVRGSGAGAPNAFMPTSPPGTQPNDRRRRSRYWSRPVSAYSRIPWILGIIVAVPAGVAMCVAAGYERNPHDVGPFVAGGVSLMIFGLFSALMLTRQTFYGWWGYLVKPLLIVSCLITGISSAIVVGNLPYHPRADDVTVATFLIVFSAVLLVVLLFIPGKFPLKEAPPAPPPATTPSGAGLSPYRLNWALMLTALIFAGVGGLQRLYVGKIGSGIVWLLTGGLFGIGQLIDAIQILRGEFTDCQGRRLTKWGDAPFAGASSIAPPQGPPPPHGRGLNEAIRATVEETVATAKSSLEEVRRDLAGAFGHRVSPRPADAGQVDHVQARHAAGSRFSAGRGYSAGNVVVVGDINFRGMLSALAGLLIFVATLASLGLALDVPGMLAAGVPTPDAARELEANLFTDIPDWPALMRRLAAASIGLIMVVALTVLVFARQRGGVIHMLRGVTGATGLLGAMVPLGEAIAQHAKWPVIGKLVEQKQYTVAVDTFVNAFQTPEAVVAGIIFVMSIILLAWPARQKAVPTAVHPWAPSPPHGVSEAATTASKGA